MLSFYVRLTWPYGKEGLWKCVDQLLQNITSNDLPFGGKPLGLGGFRQVAPVIRHGSDPTERFEVLCLTAPIRYAGDPAYADWVDRVGDDLPPYETTVDLGHLAHMCAGLFRARSMKRVDRFNEIQDREWNTYHSHDTINALDDVSFYLPIWPFSQQCMNQVDHRQTSRSRSVAL